MKQGQTHFGSNGLASCGLSKLLVLESTQDIQAVDCIACLWHVVAEMSRQIQHGMVQMDIVLARCKQVTDEKSFLLRATVRE